VTQAQGQRRMSLVKPEIASPLRAQHRSAISTQEAPPAPVLDDRDLARKIGRIEPMVMDVAVWRHLGLRETPGSGEGARGMGGRFNPPDSFPVVYGTLGRLAVGAEFRRMAQCNPIGIERLLPRHVYRSRMRSAKVLDLRRASVWEILGFSSARIQDVHPTHTQLIGELARALGFEVVVANSVTGIGDMVAIFSDLVPRTVLDFRHMELWASPEDVPGADADLGLEIAQMSG
jgi:RES domain-containing protein